jgi:hypothetical protein
MRENCGGLRPPHSIFTEHDIKPTLLIADASDAVLRLAYLDRSKTSVETVGWP